MATLEKSPIAGPIRTLGIKGMDVQVYAGNPDRHATFQDARPWRIVAGASLVKPSVSPLFDSQRGEVTAAFEIIGPSHFTDAERLQIQTEILNYYSISDGSIRPEHVATTFIPVEDFEIWFGKSTERKVKEEVGPGSNSGTIAFIIKITDQDELDDLNAGKLDRFTVTFVAFYLMQTTARVSVSLSAVQTAIADAVNVSAFRQGQDYQVAAVQDRDIKSEALLQSVWVTFRSEEAVNPCFSSPGRVFRAERKRFRMRAVPNSTTSRARPAYRHPSVGRRSRRFASLLAGAPPRSRREKRVTRREHRGGLEACAGGQQQQQHLVLLVKNGPKLPTRFGEEPRVRSARNFRTN